MSNYSKPFSHRIVFGDDFHVIFLLEVVSNCSFYMTFDTLQSNKRQVSIPERYSGVSDIDFKLNN